MNVRSRSQRIVIGRLRFVPAGVIFAILLTACSSAPKKPPATKSPSARAGAFLADDGPGDVPADLDKVADAVPKRERYHGGANRPYTVFGRSYVPIVNEEPFRQTGVASWYGRKFHGNPTSIGEPYDMYAMTAAHPTLPLPCYVRVTNPANRKSVIVRVNDRGPFHSDRIIDLSYAAAHRLDIARKGSGLVTIERVFAGEPAGQPAADTVAATVSPAAPAIAVSPVTREGESLFLQLGAFGMRENAEFFKTRMLRELDWNREALTVIFKDGLWRVRMGPYATRVEAEAVAARVRQMHDFSPLLTKP